MKAPVFVTGFFIGRVFVLCSTIFGMEDIRILFLQDGDRRWAEQAGLSYAAGYLQMARKIALVVEVLHQRGISKLYLPTNSIANLLRPIEQVDGFFAAYLRIPEYTNLRLAITLSGDFDRLPESFKPLYRELSASSDSHPQFELVLLLNWSLLDEIARITQKLATDGKAASPDNLLAYSDIPEPIDLIIRTGKRTRLSSFIPLSGQYAELYFMDILFPDIERDDINRALDHYKHVAPTRTRGT